MSMFSGPKEHAQNPPESWQVVKVADRLWHLRVKGETHPIDSYKTRREAEQERQQGRWVNLYRREGDWYAGRTPAGWRPYSKVAQ